MSDRVILNTEITNNLISTDILGIIEKYQKKGGKNYFFTPTISIKLFKPKVTWIDSTKKNVSFLFKKHENLNLYTMLRNVNNSLTYFYKTKAYNPIDNISPFFYEKGDYFYVKSYLPNINGKYLINSYLNNIEEIFKVPRIGIIYDVIILDIRNIWEKDNHAGFNLELKETCINIT